MGAAIVIVVAASPRPQTHVIHTIAHLHSILILNGAGIIIIAVIVVIVIIAVIVAKGRGWIVYKRSRSHVES